MNLERPWYPAICKSGSEEVPYYTTNALYRDEDHAKRDLGSVFVRLAKGPSPWMVEEQIKGSQKGPSRRFLK